MEEQIKNNDTVLQQMAKFNFETPIKVTLILEETETDQIDELFNKFNNQSRHCPPTLQFHRQNPDIQKKSTNNHFSSDICFDTMENTILNTDHETHRETRPHISNYDNLQNNYETSNQAINNEGPIKRKNTFLSKNGLQNDINSNNGQNLESSTDKLTPIEKKRILKLLDTVSYNLIEISKCYHNIFSFNSNRNHSVYEKDMARYLNFKHRYFNFSYNTVDSIIVPQETNQYFIQMYIKRTITLAQRYKYLYNISNDYLLNLIHDMINWTKQKKKILDGNPNEIQFSSNNILNKTPTTNSSNVISNNHSTNKDNNNICLFSCGPENRKLNISIDPQVLKTNQVSKTVARIDKKISRSRATKIRKSKTPDNKKISQSCANKTPDNSCHTEFIEHHDFHEKRSQTQATIHLPNINTTCPPRANCSYNNLAYNNPEVIDLESDYINDQNQFTMTRSSVSRDSGFGSPVPTTCPGNPMTNTQDSIRNNFAVSLTSHTNSTNPNEYTVSSVCKVCCSETNMMCIGCYQAHYCSSECQKKDWPYHKFLCRR